MRDDVSQKIGCAVTSCRYNKQGRACSLESIQVEPCENAHTGDPSDESMCGSYRNKS